jgi:hypothetical protein
MMRIIAFILFSFFSTILLGQTPIDITENTLKISPSSEEVFFYGLREGDQLIFNFEELNGKVLKELDIKLLPAKSIFMEYKTNKIENKNLNIAETGIYQFRFANANIISGRICKFKIQRIPSDENSKKFNTTVYDRTVYDTTYTYEQEKYILKSDTIISEILNQTAKVHSSLNMNGNKTTTSFTLPKNTVTWSYYIGVDQEGQKSYEDATKELISKTSLNILKVIKSNPLIALALGITPYLSQIQRGEDVDYALVDVESANSFTFGRPTSSYKNGKIINEFSKMSVVEGRSNLAFCFSNDNAITPVSVMVKVIAVQANTIYATRQVKKMMITSKQEKYLKY